MLHTTPPAGLHPYPPHPTLYLRPARHEHTELMISSFSLFFCAFPWVPELPLNDGQIPRHLVQPPSSNLRPRPSSPTSNASEINSANANAEWNENEKLRLRHRHPARRPSTAQPLHRGFQEIGSASANTLSVKRASPSSPRRGSARVNVRLLRLQQRPSSQPRRPPNPSLPPRLPPSLQMAMEPLGMGPLVDS